VSGFVRLTLVSHAMTDAMSAARFPADEPLNDIGRREVKAVASLQLWQNCGRLLTGPERRTRETAELLNMAPDPEPALADLDCGSWRGRTLDDIPAADLAAWRTDPAAAAHGGESIVGVVQRVAGWLDTLSAETARTVAVTHPAIVRAAVLVAVGAPPESFWRIDVAPVSRTILHYRGECWTLRL
jgi:broad specificity phosphatase PhoE